MSYTALYRKFRPARFEDVKGQDHIVTTLRNQIKSDKIQHAYLFCGTRGTGKTSVAKLFAKAINCEHPTDGNPCLECPTCKAIASHSALNVVEIDAASNNGVDNIRQIIEEIAYPPTDGRFKVYIIDEVHMLSIGAFNALLKTLEEPPSYVVFILATTEVHKLPVTILSRCQRYDFKRISVNDIVERINELLPEEGIEADDDAIRYIAKNADGALRDALSLLDQCIAFNFGQRLTYEMVLETLGAVDLKVFSVMLRSIISGRVSDAIASLNAVIMEGRDLSQFVSDFTWYLRNLLLAVTSDDISSVVDMSKENLDNLSLSYFSSTEALSRNRSQTEFSFRAFSAAALVSPDSSNSYILFISESIASQRRFTHTLVNMLAPMRSNSIAALILTLVILLSQGHIFRRSPLLIGYITVPYAVSSHYEYIPDIQPIFCKELLNCTSAQLQRLHSL